MPETSRLFRASASWVYNGTSHTMVAVNADKFPSMAILSNDKTGEMCEVPLLQAISGHSHWVTPAREPDADMKTSLELLSPKNRATAFERASHIREVLCGNKTGEPFNPKTCDRRFDPARYDIDMRMNVKIADLKGIRGYSRSTLFELRQTYLATKGNVAALAPGGIPVPSDPRIGIKDNILDLISATVAILNSERKSSTNLDAKIVAVRVALDNADVIDPALTARRLKNLIKLYQRGIPQDSAVQRRNKESRNISGHRRPRPSRPLKRVEVDGTPLNIEVFDHDSGGSFRPHVLVATCCATKLFHTRLCAGRPTTRDVKLLLFEMMRPIVLPDIERDHLIALGIPEQLVVHQSDEIGSVVVDNGGEMVGVSIIDLALRFGIDIEGCRSRTGSDKGQVESANASLDLMQQWFAGYVGNSSHKRGSEVKAAISFRAASRIVQEFAHTFHPYLPHTGLPADPHETTLLSPAQAYARALARGGWVETRIHADDVFGLLESAVAAVDSGVVRHDGLKYASPELNYITRETNPSGKYEKTVRIHFDPADKSRTFFYSTEREKWCELQAIHDDGTAVEPFSDILMADYMFELRQKKFSPDEKLNAQSAFVHFCNRIIEAEPGKWAHDRAKLQTALQSPEGTPNAKRPIVSEDKRTKAFPVDVSIYEIDDFEMAKVYVSEED
ncbi:transposase [Williamsia sp.]|uniref:transposase n=1 Tax=Williamsia sp. TaxID=1872085 RepID=UPI002F91FA46